jgi:hypothetical protein
MVMSPSCWFWLISLSLPEVISKRALGKLHNDYIVLDYRILSVFLWIERLKKFSKDSK